MKDQREELKAMKQEESQERMRAFDHFIDLDTESFSGDLADQSIANLISTVLHARVPLVADSRIIVASEPASGASHCHRGRCRQN